jgi:hypothetical protein
MSLRVTAAESLFVVAVVIVVDITVIVLLLT